MCDLSSIPKTRDISHACGSFSYYVGTIAVRFFRNNDKSTLRSGAHGWAPCAHRNLWFRYAHFCPKQIWSSKRLTNHPPLSQVVIRHFLCFQNTSFSVKIRKAPHQKFWPNLRHKLWFRSFLCYPYVTQTCNRSCCAKIDSQYCKTCNTVLPERL